MIGVVIPIESIDAPKKEPGLVPPLGGASPSEILLSKSEFDFGLLPFISLTKSLPLSVSP
jgi:hypothetical protein